MADTPDSPPAPPVIPVGLATKLGIVMAILSAVAAAITPLLDGDQTPEVVTLLVAGGLAALRVIDGRMSQATAAIRAQPRLTDPATHGHEPVSGPVNEPKPEVPVGPDGERA